MNVASPAVAPAAPAQERCTTCHGSLLRRPVVHRAVQADNCTLCHKPAAKAGKCQSRSASAWVLTKDQPDLCYSCHKRKDTAKEVHTAVRAGECLECHAAHASELPALAKKPREQMCLSCHDLDPLVAKPVKHAPAAEGRCLDCHDPHGSDLPKALRAAGRSLCLRCHEQGAPAGKGTPGPGFRLDLKKAVVHFPAAEGECSDCHEPGHGGRNLRLLKETPPKLCYGCHERQDTQKYVHGAVQVGDCAACHDPHSSSQPKLLARDTQKDLCFTCHQDDISGRAAIHKPVAEGKCLECHGPHGAPHRHNLVKGEGKQACYACHQPVDRAKVRHAALDRYGCTGCHDPHGTGFRSLLPRQVNALCTACHPGTRDGYHVTAMVKGGHLVAGGPDPRRPGREFSCASCHNPHGSDNPRMFYHGASPMESCEGCHGDKSGRNPGLKPVARRGREGPGAGGPGGGAGGPGGGAGIPGGGDAAPGASTAAPPEVR